MTSRIKTTLLVFAELLVVLAIVTGIFRLWEFDFSVPFNYDGDTVWFLTSAKAIVQNGWAYEIPQLSAPFSLSMVAFPAITNLDWVVMKAISLVTSDAGTVLNSFWLLSIGLTALSATLALRLLGVREWLAFSAGILYAVLPYVFMRNVAHIALVYFCVPPICTLAIDLARGEKGPQSTTIRRVGYLGALAQGFDYIYYSFFAALLFAISGLLGYRKTGSWRPAQGAAIAIGILTLSSALNLAPSYLSWHEHGKPPGLDFKTVADGEIFGLKIRRMLAPHPNNKIPPLGEWGRRDQNAAFPMENENMSARLGPFGSFGFVLLVAVALGLVAQRKSQEDERLRILAILSLFILLVATVGGFGAIFNTLVVNDIRSYNRFSVFLAFFAFAGLALWSQVLIRDARGRGKRRLLVASVALLIVVSLYDQLLDAKGLRSRRAGDAVAVQHERAFVERLEANLPGGSMVFQLPITGVPDGGIERMLGYDHARAFVWSNQLHWSWPSFSQRHRAWVDSVERAPSMAEALALSGFSAIWLDRFGYKDEGREVLESLLAQGAVDILPGTSGRYAALDLRPLTKRLREQLGVDAFDRRSTELLVQPYLQWGAGFYGEELDNDGKPFRWSNTESSLVVRNPSAQPMAVSLSFLLGSPKRGRLVVSTKDKEHDLSLSGTVQPPRVDLPMSLAAGDRQAVWFSGDMGRVEARGESRDLRFFIINPQLIKAPSVEQGRE